MRWRDEQDPREIKRKKINGRFLLMFPLSWLLIAWLIAVGIFAILALLTLGINFKYGVSSFTTFAMSALFIGVTLFVVIATCSYIATVDWSQSVDMSPALLSNPTTGL